MANNVTMGRAYVVIGAKIDGSLGSAIRSVSKQLNSLGNSFMKIGGALTGVGTAITSPMIAVSQVIAKSTDDIAKAARRTGTTTEFMSAMGHAAQLAGTDMETFEKSLFTMSRTIHDAGMGLSTATEALDSIGLKFQDLDGLTTEQQFTAIAEALSKVTNQSQRAAAAAALLGRGGRSLAPLLAGGAAGIQGARQETQRLGISVSPADAKAAEDYQDIMTRLQAAINGIGMTIARVALPAMERVATITTNLIARTSDYLRQNQQLIQYLWDVGRALVAVGAGFIGIGAAIKVLAVVVSPSGVLVALAATLLYITGALDPVIGKVTELAEEFEVAGRSVADWARTFMEVFSKIGEPFKGISSLMIAAFDLVWVSMKNGFGNALSYMKEGFGDLILEMGRSLAESNDTLFGAQGRALQRQGISLSNAAISGREENNLDTSDATKKLDDEITKTAERFKAAFVGVGAVIERDVKPALDKVFGKDSSAVTGFMSIFENLQEQFSQNMKIEAPEVGNIDLGVKNATRVAFESRGTFSGRAAAQLGAKQAVKIAQDQLEVLKGINRGVASLAIGRSAVMGA